MTVPVLGVVFVLSVVLALGVVLALKVDPVLNMVLVAPVLNMVPVLCVVLVLGVDVVCHTSVDLLADTWNAFAFVVGPSVVLAALVIVDHLIVFADIVFFDGLDEMVLAIPETENLDEQYDSLSVAMNKGPVMDDLVGSPLTGDLEGLPLKNSRVWEITGALAVLVGNHVKDDATD